MNNKLGFVECSPMTRRNFSEKRIVNGRLEAVGINLTCGRNFYNEIYVYKFAENENENDHGYPWSQDTEFVLPLPDEKDGIVKIFDNWSALTRQQIACTCPFYDIEKGCTKAQELGVKKKPKQAYKISTKKPVKNEVYKDKNTRACLLTIDNFKETFEESLKDYITELKNEIDNPLDFVDEEVPFLYEAFLLHSCGKPILVKVPKTLDELEESFFSSVKDLNNMLSPENEKEKLIKQIIANRKEEKENTELTDVSIEVRNDSLENSEIKEKSNNMFSSVLDDFNFN